MGNDIRVQPHGYLFLRWRFLLATPAKRPLHQFRIHLYGRASADPILFSQLPGIWILGNVPLDLRFLFVGWGVYLTFFLGHI